MRISSDFDGGNITCLACADPDDIQLVIDKDSNSDFYQWFHFRLSGARGHACTLKIVNASATASTTPISRPIRWSAMPISSPPA